ncbi:beta-galactosidase, partial [bacterium]|nr:beta-galactosidase [bacterium]
MSIEILHSGLRIDGRPVPLLSGSMHYWRVRPTHWEECLLQLKGLDLPIVTTYVPWSVHEVERDVFDFGERDPQKNLAGFVQLAAELGLFVMLRPGPHINAELTDFGFPSRVLDDVRGQACGPDGEPIILPAAPKAFPAPSYASEKFWKEMEGWFRAAAGIIEPLTHPNGGPVVGLQCDNELSYFFRTGAYDQDYSDGALAAYHGFLEERYGDAATVGDAYGIGVTNFREIQPPTEFAAKAAFSLPYYLDWMEFRERLLGGALARMRLLWESMGVRDILFTHNLPTCLPGTPFNIPRDERSLHVVGIDFYPRRKDYPNVKQRTRALEGVSRLPFSPEFTAGAYQLWPPLTLEDQEFAAMATLMHGLRGYNFYMAVERERWYGSPITRTGAQRPGAYESLREFVAFLKDAEMLELEMEARVLLLAPRIYDRLEKAATLFGNLPPIVMEDVPPEYVVSEHPLGFEHCV